MLNVEQVETTYKSLVLRPFMNFSLNDLFMIRYIFLPINYRVFFTLYDFIARLFIDIFID